MQYKKIAGKKQLDGPDFIQMLCQPFSKQTK
jgi:hypothetical protein